MTIGNRRVAGRGNANGPDMREKHPWADSTPKADFKALMKMCKSCETDDDGRCKWGNGINIYIDEIHDDFTIAVEPRMKDSIQITFRPGKLGDGGLAYVHAVDEFGIVDKRVKVYHFESSLMDAKNYHLNMIHMMLKSGE